MARKSDVASGAEHAPGFRSRRTTRVDVSDGRAKRAAQDVYNVEVKVQNVSTAGFMAECSAPVRIGSYVSLDIPGIGQVQAQVRWQIGLSRGGMFLDPISLKSCDWTAEKAAPAEAV